jgi:hypothetical protein
VEPSMEAAAVEPTASEASMEATEVIGSPHGAFANRNVTTADTNGSALRQTLQPPWTTSRGT